MTNLLAGRKFRMMRRDDAGEIIGEWPTDEIDLTTKVVCKSCNEGWMSNLEQHHAMPALTDLILGKDLVVNQSRADKVARFAFKTAVVVDHMARRPTPFFFSRSVRHHFAKSLTIPRNVRMWFTGYLPAVSGRLEPFWYKYDRQPDKLLKLYTCTYSVGHFVFQVVSAEYSGIPSFSPQRDFENLSVPFWPTIPEGIIWPPPYFLRTRADFEAYADRWRAIRF
jgi:hypothetical protein